MNIPKTPETQNTQNTLKTINNRLEIIKQDFSDPLEGVLTYNKKGICTSFFDGEKEITTNDINQKEKEIKEKIKELTKIEEELKKEDLPENIKNVYIRSIKGIKNKFIIFENALYIEANKSGYNINEETRKAKISKITELQKIIYGPRVSDTIGERNNIINQLENKFTKNKNKLSEEEIKTYENFLQAMKKEYEYKEKIIQEEETQKKEEDSEPIKKHKNDKVIPKEKIKEYTNKILNIYKEYFTTNNNIENINWSVEITPEKKSLYISPKERLEIPESYDNISKEKLTKTVVGHEIEEHLLKWNNTNRLLGEGFMGEGYDLIGEGVAKINEAIAAGEINSLEDLKQLKEKPGLGLIGIFICENHNYKESVEILRIYNKLGKRKDESECLKKAEEMATRRKRFFDYNFPGSSIKDSLYDRGKNEIIDILTENNDLEEAIKKYKDLNFGKLGKEDIKLIPELKKELDINENQILYTLMISRIINDKLIKGKGSAKEYINPLKMEKINFSTKKQLVEVLQLIKNS